MEELKKKVAFLQGLMSGMDFDSASKEGRLFKGMLEVLEEMAEDLDDLWVGQNELEYYLESMDEDLSELEDELFLDEDDFEEVDYDDVEDDDEAVIEVECPECGDVVYFEADVLDDDDYVEITCPHCETVVFINNGEYELYDPEEDDEEHDHDNDTDDI